MRLVLDPPPLLALLVVLAAAAGLVAELFAGGRTSPRPSRHTGEGAGRAVPAGPAVVPEDEEIWGTPDLSPPLHPSQELPLPPAEATGSGATRVPAAEPAAAAGTRAAAQPLAVARWARVGVERPPAIPSVPQAMREPVSRSPAPRPAVAVSPLQPIAVEPVKGVLQPRIQQPELRQFRMAQPQVPQPAATLPRGAPQPELREPPRAASVPAAAPATAPEEEISLAALFLRAGRRTEPVQEPMPAPESRTHEAERAAGAGGPARGTMKAGGEAESEPPAPPRSPTAGG